LKVRWSPQARERAYEEARYIALDKPAAASTWLDGLFDSTARLENFPESGRIVPELGRSQYREIIFKGHRVIYLLRPESVSIITVQRAERRLRIADLLP
jgi:toxin ParE1/3/4